MNSIVSSVMRLVTPQVTGSLASRLGGSKSAVQSGMSTAIAILISGIAGRAGDPSFMMRLFNLLRESDTNSVLNNLPELASGTSSSLIAERGVKLLSMLFGHRQAAIEYAVEQQAGLGIFTGSELMLLAAPLTAGVLGQQIHDQRLSVFAFSNFIRSESVKVRSLLPVGMESLLSGSSLPSAITTTTPGSPGIMKRAVPFLGLLALAAIAWPISGGCRSKQPTAASAVQAATAPGSPEEFIKRRVPDGTELHIRRLGIEDKLLDFIEDSSRPVDKTTWFDFDRLTFDTGAATLQSSSSEQLQNIVEILKAYPRVDAKIGGYTDNTGDKETNLKLSESRAVNVMRELASRGANASRLEAWGYGEDHPVADNATEEGRQKNRRISLLVTAK